MRARDAAGSRPLITVITVVFNNRDGFAGTAASVCEQKDASFEWVVIDGGSTDGTVDSSRRMRSIWRSGFPSEIAASTTP